MTKLFLDVDGVLNAEMPAWPGTETKEGRAQGFRIRWSPAMIEALSSLDLDLTWCTTWVDKAATDIGALIGYGQNARHVRPRQSDLYIYSIEWKFPAVQRQYTPGEKFVWIDDELETHMMEWAASVGGMAIRTKPHLGITPAHIEHIKEYTA